MNILLYILILIIPIIAQLRVTSAYNKYKRIENSNGLSGFEVARKILDANGLDDIYVVETNGNLTDHYDPSRKVIKLSKDIFHGTTIAASSVAAHECGHAIQHKVGYGPLKLRTMIVPAANLGSRLGMPIILLGLFFGGGGSFLVNLGIWVFSLAVLFQIVTLPVEFNASDRALVMLEDYGILGQDEKRKAKSVLSAAAMTYVAAAASSILQLLRLIILFGGRNNDRD